MKKTLFLLIFCLFLGASTVQAEQILWGIDPDGNLLSDNYYGSFVYGDLANSWSYTETYGLDPVAGDYDGEFRDWGVWNISDSSSAGNLADGYEITGIYDYTGTISNGVLTFTAGYLEIRVGSSATSTDNFNDDPLNNADGVYLGANDGILIGRFLVTSGSGVIDPSGVIGSDTIDNIDVNYVTDWLLAGYWGYDLDGDQNTEDDVVDLSTVDFTLTIGHSNTTSQADISDRIAGELEEYATDNSGVTYDGALNSDDYDGDTPITQLTTHGGEFDIQIVPEPGTFLLFGLALLGFAGIGRKKITI